MTANINEDEMRLLAYLHEHATGYTEDFQFDPEQVQNDLKIDTPQLQKDLSYLASHGLAGMDTTDASTMNSRAFLFNGLWLTGLGEDYMRKLENEPSVGRRLTSTAVKELWQAGKGPLAVEGVKWLWEIVRQLHH